MKKKIIILPGDGIGKEVTASGKKVLEQIAECFGDEFIFDYATIGHEAIEATGNPLPDETLVKLRNCDAILFGAVGHPKYDNDPGAKVRPEQGLLAIRKALGLFANLRPVTLHPALVDVSTLKPEVLKGTDIMVVRELTGGIYFGEKTRTATSASDLCTYTVEEIERVTRVAGQLARQRRKQLVSVDKANVLETSRLWRSVVERVMKAEFPDVQLEHILVDAAAMHLIRRPSSFDVIVTENMFGDILTDEASMLAGSLGMLPSASLGTHRTEHGIFGFYEPIHGSAPDIAGQDKANPVAAILSGALLLRYSLGLTQEAAAIESAVEQTIATGYRTEDLHEAGAKVVGTQEMGRQIIAALTKVLA